MASDFESGHRQKVEHLLGLGNKGLGYASLPDLRLVTSTQAGLGFVNQVCSEAELGRPVVQQVHVANAASDFTRPELSPAVMRSCPATSMPIPKRSRRWSVRASTMGLMNSSRSALRR
jgi:hypothetical protein